MLVSDHEMRYEDVAQAAKEALHDTEKRFNQTWLKKVQEKNPRAFENWSKEEDQLLSAMAIGHAGFEEMMDELGRSCPAILSRLKKLRLPEPEDVYEEDENGDGIDF